MNKEAVIGSIVALLVIILVASITGLYGVLYIGVALLFTIISISLFTKKSVSAKAGAVILNPSILFKVLLPNKYKKAIEELNDQANQKAHNKAVKRD